MIKSTRLKKCLLLLTLFSSLTMISVDDMLNQFYSTETIDNAINLKPIDHVFEGEDIMENTDDADATVSNHNDIDYQDDEPIPLPGSLTTDYYRPETEKYESVQDYWEKEILFMKWNDDDKKPLFAMDTEKPVYKPGEIVRVTIFFYDRFNKKPISLKDVGLMNPTLNLFDANRKSVIKFELAQYIDQPSTTTSYPKFHFESEKVSSVVEFKLDDDFAGGFYTWEFTCDSIKYQEKTNFFVSSYRNVKEAIILDFNKDTLLPGDDVMAKVTLKLLGNDSTNSQTELEFTYRVVDDTGKELESKTKKMKDRIGYIMYDTPQNLESVKSIDILVSLNYNGNELTAVKKLVITDIESVRVDFTPAGGKYSMNMENEVFFQAYADIDRTVPIEIENGTVIKLCYAFTEPDINTKPDNGKIEPNPEEPVQFANPNIAEEPVADEGRLLESERIYEGSIWDKFLSYFTSMIDHFLGLDIQKIDDGGVVAPIENGNDKDDGIWNNEEGLKTKEGFHLSPTNNYSKLPQNKYSTKKILDAGIDVETMIKSNEDGKGSFKIIFEPNCSYYMTVTKSIYYTHFFMVNTSKDFYAIDHSDMRLTLDKKVMNHDDTLKVTVTKVKQTLATKFRLLVQNNGNILKEQVVNFGACETENVTEVCKGSVTLNVSEFNKNDGGVFTIQIYRDEVYDYPEQESLIYIYPQNRLEITKTYNKEKYQPGDEVEIDLKIDNSGASSTDYFYRVVVSDESAFLQLEKRNLPPTLFTKVLLEKELRGVDGILDSSHAYLNWMFENNDDLLKEEYLMDELVDDSEIKNNLKSLSMQKLEMLLGNQRWRQLFLTGRQMASFLRQVGYNYNYYSDAKDYFGLDYWVGCLPSLIYDSRYEGKLSALLPFSVKNIVEKSNYLYGGGYDVMEGEIMFDAMPMGMPEMEEVADDARAFDEKDMGGGSVANDTSTTSTSSNASPPEETGNASTEANNNIDLESDMINENTVFFTTLGWSNSDKIKFTLPSDVSKFRVNVIAISKDGKYGMHTDFVSSQKNFDVNIDYPNYVYASETIDLEVNVYNNSSSDISVTNDHSSDSWDVSANNLHRQTFSVPGSDLPKTFKFTSSTGENVEVLVNPTIKNGLNFKHSKTLMIRQVSTTVMPDPILLPSSTLNGSVLVKATYTPLGAPVILSGYETLIQEPFGCFEQTSSTTFPMVILMQYLNLQKNPADQDKIDEMKFKITENLQKGVKKLLSFETSTGGFEWFGESPGHVTLTAYGLWQFLEMNKIGNYVDLDVIDRTLNWLREKYSTQNITFPLTEGLDSFGNPPQEVSDIYIVFVMSMFDQYQIDYSSIINSVISKYESGNQSTDSYMISFVGLLYENLDEKTKANSMAQRLVQNQDSSTGEFTSVDATITQSYGKSKSVEATAIAILFLLKNDSGQYMEQVEKAVDYLMKNMSFGYFFSTQATVLALKALVTYSEYMAVSNAGLKSFDVAIEGITKTYEVDISEDPDQEYDPIVFEDFKDTDKTSLSYNITPNFTLDENSKYVFSIDYEYETDNPLSVANSSLKVEMSSNSLSNAESFSLKVTNQTANELGMVNMIFYKPSNLKVNLNDLETLRKLKKIDYYELLKDNSEIVFYWRGIGANASYEVDITLSKEFELSSGFGAKVGAYLYYDKDGSIVFA
jgi:hypothetical protein